MVNPVGTNRYWRKVKPALIAGGLSVPDVIIPDPSADLNEPPSTSLSDMRGIENWIVTEDRWRDLRWNSPRTPMRNSDGVWGWHSRDFPDIGDKPAWDTVLQLYKTWLQNVYLPQSIDRRASYFIAKIFHPRAGENRAKEWEVRLSQTSEELAPKLAERTRMVAVCHALEAQVKGAQTLEQLEAIRWYWPDVWEPPVEGDN